MPIKYYTHFEAIFDIFEYTFNHLFVSLKPRSTFNIANNDSTFKFNFLIHNSLAGSVTSIKTFSAFSIAMRVADTGDQVSSCVNIAANNLIVGGFILLLIK